MFVRGSKHPPNLNPGGCGVESTAHNCRKQLRKRAADRKHGIESRWGHHRFWREDARGQLAQRTLGGVRDSPFGSRRPRCKDHPSAQDRGEHLSRFHHMTAEQRPPILEAQAVFAQSVADRRPRRTNIR
jgi:hypothetical protein